MSVNYTHPVDVPVTDMDDSEDDIIFNEQTEQAHGVPLRDELNTFDFEFAEDQPTLYTKFTNLFKKNQTNTYEMMSTDSFELDEDVPNRDYKITLLHKKMRNTIIGSGIIVIGLITCIIVLFNTKVSVALNINTKQIFSNTTHSFYPTTILISLDGFHPHYISPKITPTLHKMMVHDYGAPFMIPSFPSSTFPNHWTMITGLYPSEHGIVGNTFFDPILKKQFINTNPLVGGLDPDFWKGGEPIWQTAKRNGLKLAVHMWPGSEVPKIGPTADYDKFNSSELLISKVDRVMSWLDRDLETRPELILSYVPTIDEFGHKFGISGKDLLGALTHVDNFIQLMYKELKSRRLEEIVNVIIVSDHGMAPTSNERLLYLDDMVDMDKIEHIDGWPLFGLRPYEKFSVEEIYDEIKGNLKDDNFNIYKLDDVPAEWQFSSHHKFGYRLAPLWIIPRVGYSITTHTSMNDNNGEFKPKGVHGYNNTELLMRAIFLGTGPYFKQKLVGSKVQPFLNTEVYSIVCDSLKILPSPNNSTGDVMSSEYALPDNWNDSVGYPNLPFKVEHVVQDDATYDLLYRKKKGTTQTTVGVSLNGDPKASMTSGLSIETEVLPKPTDFVKPGPEDSDKPEEEENPGQEMRPEIPTEPDEPEPEDGPDDDGEGLDELIGEIFDGVGSVVDEAGSIASSIGETFKEGFSGITGWFGGLLGGGD